MSYFRVGPKSNVRIDQMVERATRLEWIVVNSETESLLLEYSLIQQHKPRYNVMLKDDKSYPWLSITMSDTWPRAGVFRGKQKKGLKYFGPYTSAYMIRETLDVLTAIFPIRTCSPSKFADYRRRGRGCLLHDLGKCCAPCVDAVTHEQYDEYLRGLLSFLGGDTKDVVALVNAQMQQASQDQHYEKAATLRDRLTCLEAIVAKQEIYGSVRENFDVVACVTDRVEICVEVFRVRKGRLLGNRRFILQPQISMEEDSVISQVLMMLYDNQLPEVIPPNVLVSELPEDTQSYEDLLQSQRGDKVQLKSPEKGSKKRLLDLALVNAQDHLDRRVRSRINDIEQRTKALGELQQQLGLSRVPLRIECFDISHVQGTNTVASMVVLDDGLPKKAEYRHFTIKNDRGNDDFLSMEEAVTRRFGAYKSGNDKFAVLPDLLLIDGGKGQLSATMRALESLKLGGAFEVASLAKKREEVFRPGTSDPVVIPMGSLSLMLLTLIRDEAHRFAITHHRKRRSDSMTASILDDIAGLGPTRKKRLLQSYGSIKELRQQSLETLQSLTYLPDNVAKEIFATLHEDQK